MPSMDRFHRAVRSEHRARAGGGAGGVAGALLGLLLLGACAPGAAPAPAAPAPYTVRWAAISANPNNFAAYTAQAQGFLAEQALDLDITYTDSSPRATQVLASRDIDVAAVATDTAIEAVERGAPFVMIGGSTRVPVYALVARPEVRSYADLRG